MKQTSWAGNVARPRRVFGVGLAAAALLFTSCGGSDGGAGGNAGDGGGDLRADVVAAIAQNVIMPALEQFATSAAGLETVLGAAAASPADAGLLDTAKDAWRAATLDWQRVEMMQLGPIAAMDEVQGGEDRRFQIYAWPTFNQCFADVQTVSEGFDDPVVLAADAGGVRGLQAIEYLLFTESLENSCSPGNPINSEGTWDGLRDDLPGRRVAYAAALAELLEDEAQGLADRWSAAGGNFIVELTDPTRAGALYGTAQEALNELSAALIYIDQQTKDLKLGKPVGLTGCPAALCPDDVESRWASHSLENIVVNLEIFRELFLGAEPGTDALGFDDLLVDSGASDVSSDVLAAVNAAIDSVTMVPGPLRDAVVDEEALVIAAHTAVDSVADLFKTDVVMELDIELPNRAAGDND